MLPVHYERPWGTRRVRDKLTHFAASPWAPTSYCLEIARTGSREQHRWEGLLGSLFRCRPTQSEFFFQRPGRCSMSSYQAQNPLIVQGGHSILVEVANPRFSEARDELARFAELVKAPEHSHICRITPLSIWNAYAAGLEAQDIVTTLENFSKYPVLPDRNAA